MWPHHTFIFLPPLFTFFKVTPTCILLSNSKIRSETYFGGWGFLTACIFGIPSEVIGWLIHAVWGKSWLLFFFSLMESPPFWWVPRTRTETALCLAPSALLLLASTSRIRSRALARNVPAAGGRRWARSGNHPGLAADTVRICIPECVGADSSITLSGFTRGYPSAWNVLVCKMSIYHYFEAGF